MIFGLFYFIFAILKLTRIWNRISSTARTFYIIQLLIIPIFIVFSGFILLFQGWRLDPILQLQQLILGSIPIVQK
ncbi:MAG: Ycf66 family protein [Cyanobacteria bacterium J06633_8]